MADEGHIRKKNRLIARWEKRRLIRLMTDAQGIAADAARVAQMDRCNFLKLLRKYALHPDMFRAGVKHKNACSCMECKSARNAPWARKFREPSE